MQSQIGQVLSQKGRPLSHLIQNIAGKFLGLGIRLFFPALSPAFVHLWSRSSFLSSIFEKNFFFFIFFLFMSKIQKLISRKRNRRIVDFLTQNWCRRGLTGRRDPNSHPLVHDGDALRAKKICQVLICSRPINVNEEQEQTMFDDPRRGLTEDLQRLTKFERIAKKRPIFYTNFGLIDLQNDLKS